MSLFMLPDSSDLEHLLADLPSPLHVASNEAQQQKWLLLDTFDWRLLKEGLVLVHDGTQLFLTHDNAFDIVREHATECTKPPVFVENIPPGAARDRLTGVIEMRALLPRLRLDYALTHFRVLDDEEKTVCRLERVTATADVSAVVTVMCEPIRGYDTEFEAITQLLSQAVLEKSAPTVKALFKESGLKPLRYSSKVKLELHPQMRADDAARKIYRYLLKVIGQNMNGLLRDIDTEFLHDFRVSVRRTRSALSQLKGVMPPDVVTATKDDFSLLGRWTNRVRDLDVYLLERDRYMAMVPPSMRDELDQFFVYLAGLRKEAFQTLNQRLQSDEYREIIEKWKSYLSQPTTDDPEAPLGGRPITEIAGQRIYKKYSRIRKMGKAIGQHSTDQQLHDLRIECKKLRYLLEFFNSLYDPEEISDLVRRLKHMQTVLGDFNDLCVQCEFIDAISTEIKVPKNLRQVIMALGTLHGCLYQEQRKVKEVCLERIDHFIHDDTHQRFIYFKEHALEEGR